MEKRMEGRRMGKRRKGRKQEMGKMVEEEKEEEGRVQGSEWKPEPSSGGEVADRQACPEVEVTQVLKGSRDSSFSDPLPGPMAGTYREQAVVQTIVLTRRLDCPQGRHGGWAEAAP